MLTAARAGGWGVQAFLERLAVFVAKQDEEIERTCNQHYQVHGCPDKGRACLLP